MPRQQRSQNYMIWNDQALNENMRIWQREQKDPEALWGATGGPIEWWQLLQEALRVAGEKNVELPPIYFPSPRQCEQFIAYCRNAPTLPFCDTRKALGDRWN